MTNLIRDRAARLLILLALLGASACTSLEPLETHVPEGGVTLEASSPDGRPFVEVFLNGEGPFTFLVDTGVVPVTLRESLAERLHLPVLEDHYWVGTTPDGRSTDSRPLFTIDRLDVGGAVFHGVTAAAIGDDGYDGVLGMALFSECTITFDLQEPTVRLQRESLDPADRWTVRCDLDDGTPHIQATVRSATGEFTCWPTLDTGAAAMLALPLALADELPFQAKGKARVRSALGNSSHPHGTVDGTLTIGPGLVVRDWAATLLDGPGLIGVRFLRDFIVSVDARSELVRIAPRDRL